MADRPYTLLSCCISMDGYLDAVEHRPLRLSNPADLERVDAARAGCDAILVGAETIRIDDPRLLVRSPALRAARVEAGRAPSPVKVTVTAHGTLDPAARFFTTGDEGTKLVFCPSGHVAATRLRLGSAATVVDGGAHLTMHQVTEGLAHRGIERLMVEGGGSVLTQFLTQGLADELHLAIAPLFVGDSRARRFVGDGRFPWNPHHRAELVDACSIGDVALLRYSLSDRCSARAGDAIPLAARFPAPPAHVA